MAIPNVFFVALTKEGNIKCGAEYPYIGKTRSQVENDLESSGILAHKVDIIKAKLRIIREPKLTKKEAR